MPKELSVIGGGVIGLTVAWRMAREGWQVRLFERHRVGHGVSSIASGMLSVQGEARREDALFRLARASRELYEDYVEAVREDSGIDLPLHGEGTLVLALNEEEAQELERRSAWQKAARLAVELWRPEQIEEVEPSLTSEVVSALFFPSEGHVDADLLMAGLRRAARRRGVHFHEGEPVVRIEHDGRRVEAVHTPRDRYPAERLLVAAGAWATQIGGLDFEGVPPLIPVKGELVVLETPGLAIRHVIRGASVSLIPRRDGSLLVEATFHENDFRDQPTVSGVASLLEGAQRLIPTLADASIRQVLVGFCSATGDHWPVLGPTPIEGLTLAVGHYRSGILLAPVTADLLYHYWVHGRVPALMQPFTLEARSQTEASPAGGG